MPQRHPANASRWWFAAAIAWVLAAPAAAFDIPITIEELLPDDQSGVARSGAPLRFGVPLPESLAVDDQTPIAIAGCEVPQKRALATYPSGRWRWMLVETLADLEAGERRATTLTVGSGGSASGAALASETTDAVMVQTGAATFRVRKQNWNGLDEVTAQGTTWITSGHDGGLVVADSGGVVFRSALDAAGTVAIESNGPLLATVVARGWVRNTAGTALFGYTARLRFTRDRAGVEMELTLRNGELALLRPVCMRWAKFELPLAVGAAPATAFGLNGAAISATLDSVTALVLYQGRTTFREDSKTNGYIRPRMTEDLGVSATAATTLRSLGDVTDHLDGWMSVGGDGTYTGIAQVCLAVRDLAPLYPTGIRLESPDANGMRRLSYDILSPSNTRTTPLVWAWGAHHTGVAQLSFGAAPSSTWNDVQFPLFARPEFEYLRAQGALYGETRLVDLATEVAWFASMGKNYTTSPPSFADVDVRRYYDFGSTGGPNQYDENLTYVMDYLRAGQRARLLQAMQDAAWKSDQAVPRSDDFDYGTRAYGETDIEVSDPDGWNGKGRNTTFENEHPHWLTLPILYWLTGNERLREAATDYCEWRRYKAGNHSYGPIYGKGMSSLRLWSRAWRDIALAWEFTGNQRYYDDMVRMTRAVVDSRESPGVRGRNLERGYLYVGDWSSASRPIRLFFLDAIHGTDAREAYRLLPDGALREDFRDYLVGLAYFTVETRLGDQNTGFPYTYNLDAPTTPGTRGDQIGMLMAHGYEWTGDPIFVQYGRDLAWRTIVDEDWERGSEPATLVRCWTDLNQDKRGIGWIEDLVVTRSGTTATLEWSAPEGAHSYIVKYAAKPLIPHLWFDAVERSYQHDPAQYTNFWAATNVQGEPAPSPAGTRQTMTIGGLDPTQELHFAIRYTATAPVPSALDDVTNLAASYDDHGRIVLDWTLPAGAVGARVVRNDTAFAGFAYFPHEGTRIVGSATTATDSSTGAAGDFERGQVLYFTVFAQDATGRCSRGARAKVTYDPPALPPILDATATPIRGEAPLAVAFTAEASDPDGDLTSVEWDPGDASGPVDAASMQHTFTVPGTYTARSTAIDAGGRTSSETIRIEVLPSAPPVIELEAEPTSGRAPLSVSYRARTTDTSALTDTLWIFEDADTTRSTQATHAWNTGGRHVARFIASDVHGNVAEDSLVIELLAPDTDPPALVSIVPAPESSGVRRDAALVIALSDSVSGIAPDSLILEIDGLVVTPQVEVADTVALTYQPPSPFGFGATVHVRLRAADRATPPNVLETSWSFTTEADSIAPVVTSLWPEDGATGVDPQAEIAVEIADAESGIDAANVQLVVDGAVVTALVQATETGLTLTWAPNGGFAPASQVTVVVRARDRATIPNQLETTWRFRTAIVPVLVNFQPAKFATPSGYVADQGSVFNALRGFGWTAKATMAAVSGTLEARLRSYAEITNNKPASWNLTLPPGDYRLDLVVGSPANTGLHRIEVEGSLVVNNVATTAGRFHTVTDHRVRVEDGSLTVHAGGIAGSTKKTKLCYLEVRSAASTDIETPQRQAENQPPTIAITALPAVGTAPVTVSFTAAVSDADGSAPTCTWNFGDGDTAAGAQVTHVYDTAGVFDAIATATDARGATARDTVRIMVSAPSFQPRLVNFQPESFTVPAGYVADHGKVHDSMRGFGWKTQVTTVATTGSTDARLRSYAEIPNNAPAVWQLAVPAGTYRVSLTVASPTFTGLHRIEVEGIVLVDDVPTNAGQRFDVTDRAVQVRDGFLTVRAGGIAGSTKKTKLCFIEVRDGASSTTAAAESEPQPAPGRTTWCIDFQPKNGVAPVGSLVDVGERFDPARGYGWLDRVGMRARGTHLDGRVETHARVANPATATWQLALPAGTYAVTMVLGSPQGAGLQHVEVEGEVAVQRVPTEAGKFHVLRDHRTRVTDGFLTVGVGGVLGSRMATQLCWLEVRPAAALRDRARVTGADSTAAADSAVAAPAPKMFRRFQFAPRTHALAADFTASHGEPFDRTRGYGWDRAVETGRARTNLGSVRNGWVEVENAHPATFTVLVPNGRYRVHVTAGSASGTGRHQIGIEGVVAIRDVATRPGGLVEVRGLEIEVRDGTLSVMLGGRTSSGTTKLSSLEIESLSTNESQPAPPPEAGLRVLRSRSRPLAPVIALSSPHNTDLRLTIFDVRGRRVRSLYAAPVTAGTLHLVWDGRDDHGGTAAAGIYFVRADLGRRSYSSKLLLAR